MNEQAFELLMKRLEDHFDDDLQFQKKWQHHADKVETKLDNLFAFKWKIVGISSFVSAIVGIAIKVLVKL